MTVDNYTAFASLVEAEVMEMDIEQQLNILSIVISAMNRKKKMNQRMSREESLALFEKFTGSMKVPADFDEKKELLDSLDERYGA